MLCLAVSRTFSWPLRASHDPTIQRQTFGLISHSKLSRGIDLLPENRSKLWDRSSTPSPPLSSQPNSLAKLALTVVFPVSVRRRTHKSLTTLPPTRRTLSFDDSLHSPRPLPHSRTPSKLRRLPKLHRAPSTQHFSTRRTPRSHLTPSLSSPEASQASSNSLAELPSLDDNSSRRFPRLRAPSQTPPLHSALPLLAISPLTELPSLFPCRSSTVASTPVFEPETCTCPLLNLRPKLHLNRTRIPQPNLKPTTQHLFPASTAPTRGLPLY